MKLQAINLDNYQVDQAKSKIILWWGTKERWQCDEKYALELLNFMEN